MDHVGMCEYKEKLIPHYTGQKINVVYTYLYAIRTYLVGRQVYTCVFLDNTYTYNLVKLQFACVWCDKLVLIQLHQELNSGLQKHREYHSINTRMIITSNHHMFGKLGDSQCDKTR